MNVQRTILCIEDENDLRNDIAEELTAADFNVIQASDGHEALALLANHRPDLVLCDITMPGLGADTMCSRPCASGAASGTCPSSS